MKDLKKKIAVISAVAMLAASSSAVFAADETVKEDAQTTTAVDTVKADEAKTDETKVDETKADETKADETKADETKADEAKKDEAKADEEKKDETSKEEKSDLTTDQVDQLITALGTFNGIKVIYNEKAIDFDVPPQIINDRTMVPLRAIFEAIGATVNWDEATRTVTAEKGDVKISLTIDVAEIIKNDQKIALDVAPVIVSDRTLVPVRAICESFGSKVDFDAENLTVIIADEVKADETKTDETKADETKADETKTDEAKADETKTDEAKADEAKADETKADDTKADEAKADNTKASEK